MKFQTDKIDTTDESRLFASLPLLLHNLATFIDSKSTGNFFIVTDDNASCRFALNNGEITHCAFKRRKGHAALEAIITTDIRGMARFVASRSPLCHDKEKIDHDYITDILNIKQLDLSSTDTLDEEDKKYMIYRGQKTERQASHSPSQEPRAKAPLRMYRGQMLND